MKNAAYEVELMEALLAHAFANEKEDREEHENKDGEDQEELHRYLRPLDDQRNDKSEILFSTKLILKHPSVGELEP